MTKEQIDAVEQMRLTETEIDAVHDIAVHAVDQSPFGYILARAALNAYKYGVMQGKRAERARRKEKAAIGAGTPTTASDTQTSGQCVNGEYTTQTRRMKEGIECSII